MNIVYKYECIFGSILKKGLPSVKNFDQAKMWTLFVALKLLYVCIDHMHESMHTKRSRTRIKT